MNFEQISDPSEFNVWDLSGNQFLRWNWKMYVKNVRADGLIYVCNISEGIEKIRESKNEFHKILNEPALSDCVNSSF